MFESDYLYKILNDDVSDVKTRIVRAAIEEFALGSVEHANIRTITDNAQVNVAAVSYYFQGKENLYVAILKDLAHYAEKTFSPHYKASESIFESQDAAKAELLIVKFITELMDSFRNSKITTSMILIVLREEVTQSKYFQYLSMPIFEKPISVIAALLSVAAKGKKDLHDCILMAQSIWVNARFYCLPGQSVLRLHGWKKIGEDESLVIKNALVKSIRSFVEQ